MSSQRKFSINEIRQSLQTIVLTATEKAQMRDALALRLSAHQKDAHTRNVGIVSPYRYIRTHRVSASVFLGFVLSASTAGAAMSSLPGDVLYPVKVHINEPVEILITRDPAALVRVEKKHAETRIREAETLISSGKLDAETKEILSEQLETHIVSALRHAGEIDTTAGPEESDHLKSEMVTSLRQHRSTIVEVMGTTTNEREGAKTLRQIMDTDDEKERDSDLDERESSGEEERSSEKVKEHSRSSKMRDGRMPSDAIPQSMSTGNTSPHSDEEITSPLSEKNDDRHTGNFPMVSRNRASIFPAVSKDSQNDSRKDRKSKDQDSSEKERKSDNE